MKYTLRDYQVRARELTIEAIRRGVRRLILQAPTGAGKCLQAADIIERSLAKGKRSIFIAHRLELLDQPYAKLVEMGIPEEKIGIIRGGEKTRRRPSAPVQIASVQSLRMDKLPPADLMIIDEAHRSMSPTHRKVIEAYGDIVVLGTTATPQRLDNKGLGEIYQEIVVIAQPSELIAKGFIVEPEVYTVPDDLLPDLNGVGKVGGDYNGKQLAVAVNKRKLVGSIVDHWLERANGVPTICFASNVEHSKRIAAEFVERGVKAEHVDGESGDQLRGDVVEKLRNGSIQVATNCSLWTEGVDIPQVKCVILARPTESLTLVLQAVGRCVRPYQGQTAIVLDHAGNIRRHGFPSDDREFSLDPKPKRRKSDADADDIAVKTCKQCYRIVPAHTAACPGCGAAFEAKPRKLEEIDGKLVKVVRPKEDADAAMQREAEKRRSYFDSLWLRAYAEGNKPGWVAHNYKEKFGGWPPGGWQRPPKPEYTAADKQADLAKWSGVAHRQGYDSSWVDEKYFNKYGEKPGAYSPTAGVLSSLAAGRGAGSIASAVADPAEDTNATLDF